MKTPLKITITPTQNGYLISGKVGGQNLNYNATGEDDSVGHAVCCLMDEAADAEIEAEKDAK